MPTYDERVSALKEQQAVEKVEELVDTATSYRNRLATELQKADVLSLIRSLPADAKPGAKEKLAAVCSAAGLKVADILPE
jgi:hypothetical protein